MTMSKVEDKYARHKGKNPLSSKRYAEFISASNILDLRMKFEAGSETSSG